MPFGSLRSFQVRFARQHWILCVLTTIVDKAAGYHGYWAEDLYAINSNYGTAADLKSLVSTAHAKVRLSQATLNLYIH